MKKDTGVRAIKFYLDDSVNKSKKDKILKFLNECNAVENKLLEYYWNSFELVVKEKEWMDFYKHRYMIYEPRLKFHHYMHVLKQVYEQLKSLQTKICTRIHFKFKEDIVKQRIYNYCSGFIFNWSKLEKYVNKQLKSYKNKDAKYYEFLCLVENYIKDMDLFNEMKKNIENRFWKIKNNFHLPIKKEFQIRCNTYHTVDIEVKEFQWIFIIDNNDIIGGTERKPVYDKIIIPVKFSNYHKEILKDQTLAKTFNLKFNKYGRIEIIGCYDVEVNYPINEVKDTIGIDIGLKKLITSSDGEVVEQNKNILHKLSRVVKKQSNRQTFEEHLKKKYDNANFKLGDKRYLRKQTKLSDYIKSDNRFKIKNFLKGRETDLIILEDLKIGYSKTKSKQVNYLLKRMGVQRIKDDILKYCKELGIKTSLINAAFTSQQCPICGYISKDNRKTQEMFCCVKCNHTDNADHNASINIKNRINIKEIGLNTPIWRVKEILGIQKKIS